MNRLSAITMFTLLTAGSVTEVMGGSNGEDEKLSCYQAGKLILESQDRLRSFQPTSAMTLLAEVSTGQVNETLHKIYGGGQDGLICVVSETK